MWDTWFARLPAGILKMPDLTLEYFEYLRPTFSLKSPLGLLIIKKEKGTSESKESQKAARLFFRAGESWANKSCSCYVSTSLFRATQSLWAVNRHPDFKPQQPRSLAGFLFSLYDSSVVRNARFWGLGGFSLCPSHSLNISY